MIHKRFIPLCAALLMALTAASARASDGRLDVVVSIKPIHALVAGVMQGVGTPHLLLNDQQSPHHFAFKAIASTVVATGRAGVLGRPITRNTNAGLAGKLGTAHHRHTVHG